MLKSTPAHLRQACWLLMEFPIHRYLMSNAHGRWDGAEKATRHIELCTTVVSIVRGVPRDDARLDYNEDFKAVHAATQALTDNLDETIGFPLESDPDYDKLAPLFFDRFMVLAAEALDTTEDALEDGRNQILDFARAEIALLAHHDSDPVYIAGLTDAAKAVRAMKRTTSTDTVKG